MSGFQCYNGDGKLTIDSDNRAVVVSQVKAMGTLIDTGAYRINSSFGDGSTLGFLAPNFFPNTGLQWFQPQTNGKYCFPGAGMYEASSGRFMISNRTANLTSGYLDVRNSAGTLIWSAASAGTMPRVRGFFTIPAGHDLSTALTLTSPFADPWICISQCVGNVSDDGTVTGYSGILIKRNSSTSFTLQYTNRFQMTYPQAMGSAQVQIALASFTGF
ncbi:hypothetical protein [Enterobacter kobei]|uniref:hypothetical protein n=1 Tax=Enterobacter kobei TaxID=208224 RepID=UPI00210DA8B5|nr:hypothetical protein [Enterobacter kobei]MCQ4375390.1 hypothetical protein [Enterobacter kobei]HDC4451919.1 hypothetical protein [Enterobacter kobei]HDC4675693.1 hypothetical protein [Enterobacter kobei]HDC4680756.1 hypothetical protein [Enterobacter kobei]